MSKSPSSRVKQRPSAGPLAPVVTTKLVPPRGAGRVVGRERLMKQLLEARRKRCIVLQGPAGCGKTTVMVAWRQALLPLDFDVAWLTLTPEDNELTRWLDYLLASIGRIDAALTFDAALLAGRGVDSEAVERTIIALVRSIAQYRRELVLILDDLHLMTDRGIHEALQFLLDYAPDNLHLVLVSRSAMPLSLARLRDQGLVLELDLRDLRFSSAESEEFLRAQLGPLERREAQLMHELTDGWVAGLQLLCMDRKIRDDAAAAGEMVQRVHVQDARAFADYFEREVLFRLPAAELDLLERAAACSRFSASLCAALLGRPDAVAETAALLAHLERDNVFILPVESAERDVWYRLHPLLGETLRERLTRRGPALLHEVHTAAWTWFRNRGLLDEAVRHAVQAGQDSAAADLLEQCAQDLATRGDLRKLIGLVRGLPAEQVQKRFGLRLWMTRLKLYARELDACAADLAQLKAEVPATGARAFALTMLQATLAVQRDDTDEAMTILPQMLQPPEGTEVFTISGRNNILSWLYMHRGEFERAREIQREGPMLLRDGTPLMGTASGFLQGRCLVGLSHALEGHMTLAERVYRDVLHQAEQGGSAWIDPAYLAAALLGEVLYEVNDTQGALQLLEDRVDVLERVSIPDSVLRVLTVLSGSHWLAGRQLEAFAYLERLQDYATNLGLDRLLAHSLGEQLHRRLQRDEFDVTKRHLEAIEAIDARYPEAANSTLGEIVLIRQRAEIRWSLAMGDVETAAAQLAALIALCEARGRQQLVAQLKLQSAVVNRRLGRLSAMRKDVAEALRHGQRLGLVRSLLDADPAALELIAAFLRESEPDPLLTFYIERLTGASGGGASVSARSAASTVGEEALSDREAEVMRLLAQAMPNKKIARTLCLSPETVKWHLKNIYGKLGVSSRDEAVARMRDAGRDQAPAARR